VRVARIMKRGFTLAGLFFKAPIAHLFTTPPKTLRGRLTQMRGFEPARSIGGRQILQIAGNFFMSHCGEWGSVEFHSRIGVPVVNALAGCLDN
jgi:hypothetical protein